MSSCVALGLDRAREPAGAMLSPVLWGPASAPAQLSEAMPGTGEMQPRRRRSWNLQEKTTSKTGAEEARPAGQAALGTLQDFTLKKTWASWRKQTRPMKYMWSGPPRGLGPLGDSAVQANVFALGASPARTHGAP